MNHPWNMLRIFVCLGLGAGLLAPGSAFAREKGDFQARRLERMKSELSLTDEQAEKIQSIMESHKTQKAEAKEDWKNYREQKKADYEKMQTEIESLLSDEQKTRYAGAFKGRGMGRRGGQSHHPWEAKHKSWKESAGY